MQVAVVNVCIDPRLDHELIRAQVRSRLEALRLGAQRIYVTNDLGGNIGSAFRGTVALAQRNGDEVVLAAVLQHDDCLAERAGLRQPLGSAVLDATSELKGYGLRAPVLWGAIRTETNAISWADEPIRTTEVMTFRMPRMFG